MTSATESTILDIFRPHLESDTLNIFYCSKRQKDKTQVKQLRQSSPISDMVRIPKMYLNLYFVSRIILLKLQKHLLNKIEAIVKIIVCI